MFKFVLKNQKKKYNIDIMKWPKIILVKKMITCLCLLQYMFRNGVRIHVRVRPKVRPDRRERLEPIVGPANERSGRRVVTGRHGGLLGVHFHLQQQVRLQSDTSIHHIRTGK